MNEQQIQLLAGVSNLSAKEVREMRRASWKLELSQSHGKRGKKGKYKKDWHR